MKLAEELITRVFKFSLNAVGGWLELSLRGTGGWGSQNPTNAVGGLLILSLQRGRHGCLESTNAVGGLELGQATGLVCRFAVCRLSMNDPPTALVGFGESGPRHLVGAAVG